MTTAISTTASAPLNVRASNSLQTSRLVAVTNGVITSSQTQRKLAVSPGNALITGGLSATGTAMPELSVALSYVGYDTKGSTAAISDINPTKVAMPSITVKVHLIKGFSYSLKSSFSYLSNAKTSTCSLTAKAPSENKPSALNLKGNSFIAKETGVYTFTWSLNNGASFVGAFNAEINGKAAGLPKTSGSKVIDSLLQGQDAWWHDKGTSPSIGTDLILPNVMALSAESSRKTLTYSFISSVNVPSDILKYDFPFTGQDKSFSEMNASQKAAAKAAFDYISSVTNLKFTEATDGSGDIQLGDYNMDPAAGGKAGLAGVSNLPNSYPVSDKVYTFVNSSPSADSDNCSPGSKGWSDIWHEIGHALGLKHPGNYDATGAKSLGPFLPAATDNQKYSIMSYKTDTNSAVTGNLSYMLYDIAALQYLYGVNTSGSTAQCGASGENGFFNFTSTDNLLRTLYSSTGKDEIDLSGLSNGSSVNLNAGTYSSINTISNGNSTRQNGSTKNVAIGYGSIINKVTLSTNATSDTVTLNDAFKKNAFNEVNNFQATDKLALSRSIFGSLSSKNITIGISSSAQSKDTRIVVNQATGEIFYDADGIGNRYASVKIATYKAVEGATVSKSNFAFVS